MQRLTPRLVKLEGNEKFQRLLAGAPDTAGMKSGHVTLKPGESIGEHTTEAREETIIILEGQAEFYCEGKLLFNAQEKFILYVPPHTTHDIKNNGDNLLRYVYIVAPIHA